MLRIILNTLRQLNLDRLYIFDNTALDLVHLVLMNKLNISPNTVYVFNSQLGFRSTLWTFKVKTNFTILTVLYGMCCISFCEL